MNIGQAARMSGVNQKMIRYYESIGLLTTVGRRANGYRSYADSDIHTLAFIRRARDLGFSIREIEALMALWRDRSRSSAEVKAIALRHIADLRDKIDELVSMQRTLEQLASCCAGDDRPDCPILDDLATTAARPRNADPAGS